jgi:pyrroline-5-carboxylate reductase
MLHSMSFGVIGGGNMAEALIKGLLKGGISPGKIAVSEPVESRRGYISENYAVQVGGDNGSLVADSDLILLAVKPQMADAVLSEISSVMTGEKLLVSIMAGVQCASIEAAFPDPVRVIRAMPNTPALVLQGATAIAAGTHASSGDMQLAAEIFALVGKCWQVEEKLIDAVTGLSGSGPAYVLSFIEALADGGVKNGLPRDTALGLAVQTVYGTAALLGGTGDHPAVLRDKVTSPGGTTIAGLQALEVGGFRGTVMRSVEAATVRSMELGKKK